MKERRFLFWRWCPSPERIKATRTRPSDRSWLPLAASALVLSLLAIQAIQPWAPSAVSVPYPSNYGALPTVEATDEMVAETPQASQITSVVSTEHITVQFTFPDSADPGQAIAVTATSTAKSSAKVTSLTVEVYAYIDRQLIRAASETVLKNKQVRSGDSWQTPLSVVVPQSAQRSAIIGTVTEIWEETSTYYSSYGYWPDYPYYSPYPYSAYYPYYGPYPHNYTYYDPYDYTYPYCYPYNYAYPYQTVTQKSSQQTIPLTYVLATTPEYESLMQQYQQLQQNYDTLVAEHNNLVSKYNSLTAQYDDTVSKYNQLQSDYNSATSELGNYKTYTYILAVVAVALGVAFIFLLLQRRQVTQPPMKHQTATETPKKTSKRVDYPKPEGPQADLSQNSR